MGIDSSSNISQYIRSKGLVVSSKVCNLFESKSLLGRVNKGKAAFSCKLIRIKFLRRMITNMTKKQAGLHYLMKLKIEDEPTMNPITKDVLGDNVESGCIELSDLSTLLNATKNPDFETPYLHIEDYLTAYKDKVTTPLDVVKSLLKLLEEDEDIKDKLNAVIEFHKDEVLESAKKSTQRYEAGHTLSILDGIPFFVKEEIPITGYTINFGTTNFVDTPCLENATIVQRLIDAGAILMGVTKMSYLGFGAVGFNPSKTHGHVRNPHNPEYYCGGSSTGSAAVVAAGLCPFAIGVDGFGSNRIPPSITGVVGLKSTYSRVSNGKLLHADKPYIVCGPITSCVQDAAIVYGALAGPDPIFEIGSKQPKVELPKFSGDTIKSIKFGYDASLCKMAFDDQVFSAIESFVESLKNYGCELVTNYVIPEFMETVVSMGCAILYNQARSITEHYKTKTSSMECSNATIMLALGNDISDDEYKQCCRQRTRSILVVNEIFSKFDILVSPCIGGAELKIYEGDEKCGVLDDISTTRLTRFCALASLTGIPAITINIGYKTNGMPIAVQLQSKWWTESLLLQVAHEMEQFVLPKVHRKPKIFKKLY